MYYYLILVVLLSGIIGLLCWQLFGRKKKYFGDIVVTKNKGITLFSLELRGKPEEILDQKEVLFKVVIPEEESDRE